MNVHWLYVLALLTLTGCAHYRGVGAYRGVGPYRIGADYTGGGASVGATATAEPVGPFKLDWPLTNIRLTRGYKPPSDVNHLGLDLGGKLDTPILAAHEGRVIYAGQQFHGYGNMVLLEYDNHWATLYGHLNRIHVAEGTRVRAGDLLGGMGRTGRATGVHLHFELMNDRKPVDPAAHLPALTRGLAGK